jgi:lysophospholipase L1-like esterase
MCQCFSDKASTDTDGIVLYGHSLFTQWKTATNDLKPLPVINLAFGGSTTPQLIERYNERVLPHKPRLVIINTGANYLKQHSVDEFIAAFTELLNTIHHASPEAHIAWLSVSPSPKGWSWLRENQVAATMAGQAIVNNRPYAHFIDMEPLFVNSEGKLIEDIFGKDGIHYSEEGYKIYTAFLQPRIVKIWEQISR